MINQEQFADGCEFKLVCDEDDNPQELRAACNLRDRATGVIRRFTREIDLRPAIEFAKRKLEAWHASQHTTAVSGMFDFVTQAIEAVSRVAQSKAASDMYKEAQPYIKPVVRNFVPGGSAMVDVYDQATDRPQQAKAVPVKRSFYDAGVAVSGFARPHRGNIRGRADGFAHPHPGQIYLNPYDPDSAAPNVGGNWPLEGELYEDEFGEPWYPQYEVAGFGGLYQRGVSVGSTGAVHDHRESSQGKAKQQWNPSSDHGGAGQEYQGIQPLRLSSDPAYANKYKAGPRLNTGDPGSDDKETYWRYYFYTYGVDPSPDKHLQKERDALFPKDHGPNPDHSSGTVDQSTQHVFDQDINAWRRQTVQEAQQAAQGGDDGGGYDGSGYDDQAYQDWQAWQAMQADSDGTQGYNANYDDWSDVENVNDFNPRQGEYYDIQGWGYNVPYRSTSDAMANLDRSPGLGLSTREIYNRGLGRGKSGGRDLFSALMNRR